MCNINLVYSSMYTYEAVITGILVLAAVITSVVGSLSIYDRFFSEPNSQNGGSPPQSGEDRNK